MAGNSPRTKTKVEAQNGAIGTYNHLLTLVFLFRHGSIRGGNCWRNSSMRMLAHINPDAEPFANV